MAKIIHIDFTQEAKPSSVIDIATVQQSCRKLKAGLIAPAAEEVHTDLAVEHSAEPIKSMDDIIRISQFLIGQKRFRDNMLFIVGINFGLRISDLRSLRFTHIINDDCTFRDRFPVLEKKTRNTRKRQRNRYITINTAVMEAVTLYLENTPGVHLSDYMFRSESNHGGNINEPLSIKSVDRILKGIANDLDLNIKMSTHTLRKTFCYWMMVRGGNDQRRLLLLQKMLNHASPAQTLGYIGLTAEEVEAAKRTVMASLRTMFDSPLQLENFYQTQAVAGLTETLDELIERIGQVSMADVTAAAQKAVPDTVYFLKGAGV